MCQPLIITVLSSPTDWGFLKEQFLPYPCNTRLILCYRTENVPTWSSVTEVDGLSVKPQLNPHMR